MKEIKQIKKLAVIAAAVFMSGGCASRYIDVADKNCYCTPTDKNNEYQNFAIIEESSGDTIYQIKSDVYHVSGEIIDGQVKRDTVFTGLPTKLTPEDDPARPQSRVYFSLHQKDQLCRKFKFGAPEDMDKKRILFTSYKLKPSAPQ